MCFNEISVRLFRKHGLNSISAYSSVAASLQDSLSDKVSKQY